MTTRNQVLLAVALVVTIFVVVLATDASGSSSAEETYGGAASRVQATLEDDSTLPFTGFDIAAALGGAAALVVAGIALGRCARLEVPE